MRNRKKILLFALALLIALGMACFAAACGGKPKKIAYTVTVVCEDADALEGIEVTLRTEDGKAIEEGGPKALTEGKATFELPSATYKVALSNVPEGYQWDPAWVSEERPNATVTLVPAVQKVEYTVTALDESGSPVAGARFSLADESGKTVGSAETDDGGKATIKALPATYTLHADRVPEGYSLTQFDGTMSEETPSKTVTFKALEKLSALPDGMRGSWRDLKKSIELIVSSASLTFNSERLNAYTGEEGSVLFWAGNDYYSLKENDALAGTLLLALNGEETVLLPKAGLARVEVPSLFEGTWNILDENDEPVYEIAFTKSTFTLNGKDGYVVLVAEEDGGNISIVAVLETGDEAGIYFMTYRADTGVLDVPGFELPFSKGGAGTSADPEVLKALAGDFSYLLTATSRDAGGFTKVWSYGTVYLTYTAGAEDETYTLVVTDNDLLFVLARAGSDATRDVLINWDKASAQSNYVPFTLKANTQYNITISIGKTSTSELPPCKVAFSIHEGTEAAPAKHSVPAPFHGIWYNKADDNDRLVITEGEMRWEDDTIVWGGKAMELVGATGNALTASLDGNTWTFTREEALLTGTCGQDTVVFSLLSKNPKSAPIPGVYSGLWVCENAPSGKKEYLYIVAFTATGIWPEIEYLDNGAFYWMGRAAVVTDASLFGLTIVMDDLVWEGSYDNNATLIISRGDTVYTFVKPSQYATDFSTLEGEWSDANGDYHVRVAKDDFIFNGSLLAGSDGSLDEEGDPIVVASKIVLEGGNTLFFCVDGKFYTLEKTGAALTLTLLNTGASVTLQKN